MQPTFGRPLGARLRIFGALFLLLGGLAWTVVKAPVAGAQASATPVAVSTVSTATTADQVNEVARTLWCPLCSGVRLDACELKACEQMKEEIAIKLSQGQDVSTIRAYFQKQYGPQVLGEPPLEGFNWLAWILPVVAVVGGGYYVWLRMKGLVRPAVANGQASAAAHASSPVNDEYTQKLQKELDRYR